MAIGILNFASHRRGDTWPGVPSIKITIDGDPPPAPLASVRMQFRRSPRHEVVGEELSTSNARILILDADAWEIRIEGGGLDNLDARTWHHDIEFTDAFTRTTTYLKGTMPVTQDTTR